MYDIYNGGWTRCRYFHFYFSEMHENGKDELQKKDTSEKR